MKISRITGIEVSNVCDLSCLYCINDDLMHNSNRVVGIMSDEVFTKTLELVKYFVDEGTQQEVCLNGNGEPLLDPNIVDKVRRTREVIGEDRLLMLCTNGLTLTYELASQLKAAGLGRLDVSVHSPKDARNAMDIIKHVKINSQLAAGAIMTGHNWAGQIKKSRVSKLPNILCAHLIEGRGYVQMEGNVSTCCLDYRDLGVVGHVFDSDILTKDMKPYELCNTCHQTIPVELRKAHHA